MIDIAKRLKAKCQCHLMEAPCLYCQAHAEIVYLRARKQVTLHEAYDKYRYYSPKPDTACRRDNDMATEGWDGYGRGD